MEIIKDKEFEEISLEGLKQTEIEKAAIFLVRNSADRNKLFIDVFYKDCYYQYNLAERIKDEMLDAEEFSLKYLISTKWMKSGANICLSKEYDDDAKKEYLKMFKDNIVCSKWIVWKLNPKEKAVLIKHILITELNNDNDKGED